MLLYKGGRKVGKGTYWNPADGHRVDIKGIGVLPGGERTNYLKMPPGGMLIVAPVVGGDQCGLLEGRLRRRKGWYLRAAPCILCRRQRA